MIEQEVTGSSASLGVAVVHSPAPDPREVIGLPTDKHSVNHGIQEAIDNAAKPREKVVPWLRNILSYEPRNAHSSSWPMTFGIWAYALVASAVAVTYFLNQNETPDTIKTLAVAFAGYVIALLTSVYHLTTSGA